MALRLFSVYRLRPLAGRAALRTLENQRPALRQSEPTLSGMLASFPAWGRLGLLRSAGFIFAINIAGLVTAAVAQLLLARTLGAVEFGFYAYAFTWLSLTSLIATGGFQPSVLRFGSIYVGQGQHHLMRRLATLAMLSAAVIGCLLFAAGAALIFTLGDRLQEGLAAALLLSLLATPVVASTRITGSCLRAYGRHFSAIFTEVCSREMAVLIFALLSLLVLHGTPSAADVMMTVLLVSGGALAWLHFRLARIQPWRGRRTTTPTAPPNVRAWLVSSGYLLLFSTANLLQKRLDVLLAGLVLGTTQAGAYTIAIYLAGLAVLPQHAIGFVAAPEIARLYAQGAKEQLRKTIRMIVTSSFAAAVIIGGVVWAAAPLLRAILGPGFEETVWPARLLVLGNVLNSSFGSLEVVMTMTGDERRVANLMLMLTIINVPLLLIWMNLFGLVGAAIGTTCIVLLFKISCCILLYRRTGIISAIVSPSGGPKRSLGGCAR